VARVSAFRACGQRSVVRTQALPVQQPTAAAGGARARATAIGQRNMSSDDVNVFTNPLSDGEGGSKKEEEEPTSKTPVRAGLALMFSGCSGGPCSPQTDRVLRDAAARTSCSS
jgi:hypothetical protein